MKMTKVAKVATVIFTIFITACSGGGGSTTAVSEVPATVTVPLLTAIGNEINNGYTKNFTLTGTWGTSTVTGNGTDTAGAATSAVLNGISYLKQTGIDSYTYAINGVNYSVNNTAIAYNNPSNYAPAFNDSGTEYRAYPSTFVWPASIKTGDTGSFTDVPVYTDSTLSTQTKTLKISYSVTADTASTVLFTLITNGYNMSNVRTYTSTGVRKIATDGTVARVKATYINYPTTGSQWNLTYTYQ